MFGSDTGLRVLRIALGIAAFLVAAPSLSQIPAGEPLFRQTVDENGVDLYAGQMIVRSPAISIGEGQGALSYWMTVSGTTYRHSFLGGVRRLNSSNLNNVTVYIGESAESFTKSGANYFADHISAATLSQNPSTLAFTYTTGDGTVAVFNRATNTTYDYYAYLSSITYPNGDRVDWEYFTSSSKSRVARVKTSRGYALELTYANSSGSSSQFLQVTSVKLVNLINSSAAGYPFLNFAYNPSGTTGVQITNAIGQVSRITMNSTGVIGVRDPASGTDNIVVTYLSGKVRTVNNHGFTKWYSFVSSGSDTYGLVSHYDNSTFLQETYLFNGPYKLKSYTDELGRVTTYFYDAFSRPYKIVLPEGNGVTYQFDARGNVTRTDYDPKLSSGLIAFSTTAGFDNTCSNPKTCNKPNWTRDSSSQQTDYTYSPVHGGTLTVTQPLPAPGLARPQVRYDYTPLQAWYKNAGGVMAASGVPTYMLTAVSTCRVQQTCLGTVDELKTTLDYGPPAPGNNLLPYSVTEQSGNGSVSSTNTTAYDLVGNALTVDGPLPGSADITTNYFDALRRRTQTRYPTNGSGGYAYETFTYNNVGGVLVHAEGGVLWGSFGVYKDTTTTYDTANRPVSVKLGQSGSTYGFTQLSYDSVGRLECVAQRTAPGAGIAGAATTPVSACTPGTEIGMGPDQITRYSYDFASQTTSITEGWGIAGQQHVASSVTYSPNGLPLTATDGNGNKTTFEYDGFDRPLYTYYPDKNVVGQSSATDYEQLQYLDDRLVATRGRDGTWQSLNFDALGRLTYRSGLPGEALYLGYDNHGRVRFSRFGSPTGSGISNTYDGLGRLESADSFGRVLSYEYSSAGQVSKITHPDGFFVSYAYNPAGDLSSITDNSGNVLVRETVNAYGGKSFVERGPATASIATSSYWADRASTRPGSIAHDLAAGSPDYIATFTYGGTGQLRTRRQMDGAYSWKGQVNLSQSYIHNGLNQISQIGPAGLGYDNSGNFTTGDSTWSFSYDPDNKLRSAVSAGNTVNLQYDPDGLLRRVDQTAGPSTEFLFDGTNLLAEYDAAGALLRRYVFDPDGEVVAWYEGSGTSDIRHFFSDERGSVVAVSDADGNALSAFSYSPYGETSSTMGSRFLYTGQPFLAEVGLSYYKARFYSARIGRFLQPDPIGYFAGMNRYAYVNDDPMNLVDRLGLHPCTAEERAEHERIGSPDCDPPCLEGDDSCLEELARVNVTGNRIKQPILVFPGMQLTFTPEVRSKTFVCGTLSATNWQKKQAWRKANNRRKTKTADGKSNWSNPLYREVENWLTAASDYYKAPFWRKQQIYTHQYLKKLPFRDSTEFSQEALEAGLDGLAHMNDTPHELKEWCGAGE